MPPYMLVEGSPAPPRCVNLVALKRNNFRPEVIDCLSEAHRLLYRAKAGLDQAREVLRANARSCRQLGAVELHPVPQEGRHGRARERRRGA